MAIVSVAITVSFHIKGTPSDLERRVAKPLGGIFWVLSVVTLVLGVGNYISKLTLFWERLRESLHGCWVSNYIFFALFFIGTVNMYGKRAAIVQSGWRTQVVSFRCIYLYMTEIVLAYACADIGFHCLFYYRDVHHTSCYRQSTPKMTRTTLRNGLFFLFKFVFLIPLRIQNSIQTCRYWPIDSKQYEM